MNEDSDSALIGELERALEHLRSHGNVRTMSARNHVREWMNRLASKRADVVECLDELAPPGDPTRAVILSWLERAERALDDAKVELSSSVVALGRMPVRPPK